MSHEAQQNYCNLVFRAYNRFTKDVRVLDIGSRDINGNNRIYFSGLIDYVGVDVVVGPNVDVVCCGHQYNTDKPFDVVMSTECLEHDPFYSDTIRNMVRLLKPGGLMIVTCATIGRPEHGTLRSAPQDNPAIAVFGDYYHNVTLSEFALSLPQEHFKTIGLSTGGYDLSFHGIKAQ